MNLQGGSPVINFSDVAVGDKVINFSDVAVGDKVPAWRNVIPVSQNGGDPNIDPTKKL